MVEEVRNSHTKVYITANGQEFIWTASATPSDWRNSRNAFAKLRRELRLSGVEPPRLSLRGGTAEPEPLADVWMLINALPWNLDEADPE